MRALVAVLMLCCAAVQAQTINPTTFSALNEAQQAQQQGDYAAAGSHLQQALTPAAGGCPRLHNPLAAELAAPRSAH
ncbi:MAG: hypothetical protein R6V43_10080 [Halopseudomonas sp.]